MMIIEFMFTAIGYIGLAAACVAMLGIVAYLVFVIVAETAHYRWRNK